MGKQKWSVFESSVVVLSISVLLSLGCTRDFKKTTKIHLSAGSFSSMSGGSSITGQLTHIAVNVRGPGMEIKTYSWDGHKDGPGPAPTPPSVISLEVPAGPSRLIQFLGVFKDETDPYMPLEQFTYGSVIQDLQAGTQQVDIEADIINTGSAEARLAGQYVMYDGVTAGTGVYGPTARIAEEFLAVPEDPPMIVGYTEMFNGWFQTFAMPGVPIQYRRMDTQQLLTDDGDPEGMPISLDYFEFLAGEPEILHVTVPFAFEHSCGGGNCGGDAQEPTEFYLGFVGPGALSISRWVTYNSASYVYSSISLVGGGPVNWNSGAGSVEPVDGGVADSYSGTPFVDYMAFDYLSLESGGSHEMAPFIGPFQKVFQSVSPCFSGSGKSAVGACFSDYGAGAAGKDLKIEWTYLPGVNVKNTTVKGIDGASVFVASQTTCGGDCHDKFEDKDNDGVLCSSMVSLGAKLMGHVSAASQYVSQTYANPQIPFDYYTVYVCPYRLAADGVTKQYFNTAARGFFDAQPPPMTINGVGRGSDVAFDNYYVGNAANVGPMVSVLSVSGAATYTASVMKNGNVVCAPATSGSLTISIPSCATNLVDGDMYELKVEAKNATGTVIAGNYYMFTRILNMPTLSVTSITCAQNGPSVDIEMSYNSTFPASISSLDWFLSIDTIPQSPNTMMPFDEFATPWTFSTVAPWGTNATFDTSVTVYTIYGGYSFTVYPVIPAFVGGLGCP